MKKEYSTPTMKAIMVNAASMLCGSDGELNQGSRYISGNNDYIDGVRLLRTHAQTIYIRETKQQKEFFHLF